jgi:hypothetical protein
MHLWEIGWEGVEDRDWWQALVNMVMYFQVP